MAKIEIKIEGEDTIDNAAAFLNDPLEQSRISFNPEDNKTWVAKDIDVPMNDDDELQFSIHVAAFSGTSFKCVITNTGNDKTIELKGITGEIIKNKANIKGSKKFK